MNSPITPETVAFEELYAVCYNNQVLKKRTRSGSKMLIYDNIGNAKRAVTNLGHRIDRSKIQIIPLNPNKEIITYQFEDVAKKCYYNSSYNGQSNFYNNCRKLRNECTPESCPYWQKSI